MEKQKGKRITMTFGRVRIGQNFYAYDTGLGTNSYYRKQSETTAIRSTDDKVSVWFPEDVIISSGKVVPSIPFTNIKSKGNNVVLLENKAHHWQEMDMSDAEIYIAANGLTPMTPAHLVSKKRGR